MRTLWYVNFADSYIIRSKLLFGTLLSKNSQKLKLQFNALLKKL